MANITNSINKFSLLNYQSQDNSLFGKSNKAKNFLQTQRKLNPELDASLYALDLSKAISDTSKTDELAKKVARGEKLTNEEKAFMEKTDPEKLKKAEEANLQREELKRQLKNAKTPSHAASIISSSLTNVLNVQKSGDTVMADLLMEGIKKETAEYYSKNPEDKSYHITDSIAKIDYTIKNTSRKQQFDILI